MINTNFGHLFLQGGWVMWPLLICSVVSWTVVFERIYFFVIVRKELSAVVNNIHALFINGRWDEAQSLANGANPIFRPLLMSFFKKTKSQERLERGIDRERLKVTAFFKKNLWVLGTVGSASPFIGLLGTVVGIVRAFHEMSAQGTGGFAVVSGGISEALVATAAGLVVAILALIAYNIFTTAANQTVSAMRWQFEEMMEQVLEKNHAV